MNFLATLLYCNIGLIFHFFMLKLPSCTFNDWPTAMKPIKENAFPLHCARVYFHLHCFLCILFCEFFIVGKGEGNNEANKPKLKNN